MLTALEVLKMHSGVAQGKPLGNQRTRKHQYIPWLSLLAATACSDSTSPVTVTVDDPNTPRLTGENYSYTYGEDSAVDFGIKVSDLFADANFSNELQFIGQIEGGTIDGVPFTDLAVSAASSETNGLIDTLSFFGTANIQGALDTQQRVYTVTAFDGDNQGSATITIFIENQNDVAEVQMDGNNLFAHTDLQNQVAAASLVGSGDTVSLNQGEFYDLTFTIDQWHTDSDGDSISYSIEYDDTLGLEISDDCGCEDAGFRVRGTSEFIGTVDMDLVVTFHPYEFAYTETIELDGTITRLPIPGRAPVSTAGDAIMVTLAIANTDDAPTSSIETIQQSVILKAGESFGEQNYIYESNVAQFSFVDPDGEAIDNYTILGGGGIFSSEYDEETGDFQIIATVAPSFGTHSVTIAAISQADSGEPQTGTLVVEFIQEDNLFDLNFLPASTQSGGILLFTNDSDTNVSHVSTQGVGDINGDGFDDLAVTDSIGDGKVFIIFGGTEFAKDIISNNSDNQGRDELHLDGAAANGGIGTAGITLLAGTSGAHLGTQISALGDVNGDGFDDLIVLAERVTLNSNDKAYSSAFVIFGYDPSTRTNDIENGNYTLRMTGLTAEEGYEIQGNFITETNLPGASAAIAAGDVNGDGSADMLITSPNLTQTTAVNSAGKIGVAYVLLGKHANAAEDGEISSVHNNSSDANGNILNLLDATSGVNFSTGKVGFVIAGTEEFADIGFEGDFLGDINGDGLGDLILGSDGDGAYVIFGSLDKNLVNRTHTVGDIGAETGFKIINSALGAQGDDPGLGRNVSAAGDVNADGLADLIITDLTYSSDITTAGDAGDRRGAVYVVFGRDQDSNAVANAFGQTTSGQTEVTLDLANLGPNDGYQIIGLDNHQLGYEASGIGDVNGDGFDDIAFSYLYQRNADLLGDLASEIGNKMQVFVMFGGYQGVGGNASEGLGSTISMDAFVTHYNENLANEADPNDLATRPFTYDSQYGFVVQNDIAIDSAAYTSSSRNLPAFNKVDNFGRHIDGAGDLNGDGYDDFIVSSEQVDSDPAQSFLIYGGNFNNTVSQGSVVDGKNVDEIIIGTPGHDELSTGGGADSVRAGAGNDVITIDTTNFKRIDGGNETTADTLALRSALTLDFSDDSLSGRITDIEALDLTDSAAQEVIFDQQSIYKLTTARDLVSMNDDLVTRMKFFIDGGSNDRVELREGISANSGWEFVAANSNDPRGISAYAYDLYTYAGADNVDVPIDLYVQVGVFVGDF